jgi:L-arabinokinase
LSVFFYISGHGYGHAVRQIAIINVLSALDPSLPVVVRTTAPRWLFDRTVRQAPKNWTLVEGPVDTGVVQCDSLTLDEAETIRQAAAFSDDLDERARNEAVLLQRHSAALVVADAPPLACAAASRAGVPSVVCSNFTWDWIYEGYREHLHAAPRLLLALREAYAASTAGWRLPLHGGFGSVPSIVDVPFVARTSRGDRSREDIRRALGLPLDAPLALVSFGGYGVKSLPLETLDCVPAWSVVAGVDESAMYAAGLGYQDVVRAVDVVVSKPGYGIISDCVANGTALLYTARGRFAEYDVLVAEMPRHLRCRFIDGDDFRAGRWREGLDALLASPQPERPRVDGARVVAEKILESV